MGYTMVSTLVVERGATLNALAAGTRFMVGSAISGAINITGNIGTGVFLFEADDFIGSKLRLIATCLVNDVAPVSDFTISIVPILTVSGGAAVVAGTVGASVTGTTMTFVAPAANSMTRSTTAEINLFNSGFYLFSVVNSATGTASSSTQINVRLEARR